MSETRVVVPYVDLHPRAAACLDEHAPGAVLRHIDPRDPFGYWRLLLDEWSLPGDLVIIEQDNGISAEVLPGFDDCPEPWCGHPYRLHTLGGPTVQPALGCTRFRASLKAELPNLFRDLAPDRRGWRAQHAVINGALLAAGHKQHRHDPETPHYAPEVTATVAGDDDGPAVPFRYTTRAGQVIELPALASMPAGLARRTRHMDQDAAFWTIMEELADENTLAALDALPSGEFSTFAQAWGEHSGQPAG